MAVKQTLRSKSKRERRCNLVVLADTVTAWLVSRVMGKSISWTEAGRRVKTWR